MMSENSSSQEGKHFVVQKGKARCNQGNQFPHLKVASHQKHYWNDSDGQADYLAVTEDDLEFTPSGPSFGQCRLKPVSGGYLPCTFVPEGKWQKTYGKVKVMEKSCITEISELRCSTGGTITIKDHGQTGSMTSQNVRKADPAEQQDINPLINYKEFQEEQEDGLNIYY
ncbi:DUF4280 domain-containing protein [Chryseobacterium vrystaatense]|uniref:DUF4280 domain-containing protein n=1 Tax=Chryseobacterium vrystaatense TaxID=307480 RepID=A0A1M5ILI0_9FLAO|nr:DUF4280 domain-containing protein [Chryseobacterium vrystaatense]SHG29147.1 protein of unknown function [Chryseobacterium vrystaatense]